MWGSCLHHIDDLPYDPKEYLPHIYGKFREKGAGVRVRGLVDTPAKGDMPYPNNLDKGIKNAEKFMPSLKDFGFDEKVKKDKRACYDFVGGEEQGLKRI